MSEPGATGGTGAFQCEIARDVIEAVGPDAATFLQGQLSQDVAGLADGAGAYSLLLQPQGKVDAWLRVTRTASDRFILDVDGGWGGAVLTRLSRFKLRTKCELHELTDWTCWAVRGIEPGPAASSAGSPGDALVVAAPWPGIVGFDRLGVDLRPLDGIPVVQTDRYVAARVAAGVPAMGHELDEQTIPAEAGAWLIERSVSFTKGCYTGQELVARVDSRGSNTPRKLRLVRGTAGALHEGASIELDGATVGTITSATADGTVALAYVKRSVDAPAAATVSATAVQVEPLPAG